jgi:biofilm PGA synthesis lipoprotein PgaB
LKRISFLATFFLTLALVITGGFLKSKDNQEKNEEHLQQFTHISTSIVTEGLTESRPAQAEKPALSINKQTWYRNQVVVLTYHHVTGKSDQRYVVSPEQFASHMAFLYQNDFHPITLTEFLQFVDTGVLPKENAVLLTFDDGYESYYKEAFPILKQYNFPSVNFVIAGRLRDTVERKRENMIPPLTYPQIKEMMATGLVDIASHTYSLHERAAINEWGELGPETAPVYMEDLQRLEEEQEYRNRLYVDFMMSRAALSDLLQKPIESISFPFGYANDMVVEMAKQAGYRYAFSTEPGVVKPGVDRYRIPRFDVGVPEHDVNKLHALFAGLKTD